MIRAEIMGGFIVVIKIGFAPTRRSIFSASAAVEYANLTRNRLNDLGVDFVDIDDIADDGLLHSETDRIKISAKFKSAGIDGLFVAHCNFGTEYEVARLAKELNVPVLLWGPRDECPDEQGVRLRDSQCGLFATSKVLRRFNVKFTYIPNCRLEDPEFEIGLKNFIKVCSVVRTFRGIRILQIGPRPFDFWSTMCNEGELLEKFNIQLSPIPLSELAKEVGVVKSIGVDVAYTMDYCRQNFNIAVSDKELETICALKVAMKSLAEKYDCNAIAIQCWNALQDELGIMPCAANSLLNEDGLPVVCETDIHGAVTALMVEAAAMGEQRSFFADWTVRHPFNDNGELLQHCGPWPLSVAMQKPTIGYPLAFDYPGAVEALAKNGNLTIARFDGDHGKYFLLLGNAKTTDGPYTKGTYMWIEVKNWQKLETKIVEGPYIHHCVGIHSDVVPILFEACKYIGVEPDLFNTTAEEVKSKLWGWKDEL